MVSKKRASNITITKRNDVDIVPYNIDKERDGAFWSNDTNKIKTSHIL
jgi:hypothetical protein